MELPPPEYYSISELAEYWHCTEAIIQRYILSDWLRPAFCFNGVICTYTSFELIGLESEAMPPHEQVFMTPAAWQGVFTLAGELSDALYDSGCGVTAWDCWWIDAQYLQFTDAHKASIIPQDSVVFRSTDVVVAHYEVERFEMVCRPEAVEQPETVQELVSRGKENGVKPEQLAHEVYRHKDGTDYYIGLALHGDAHVDDKSLSEKGRRFRGKNNLETRHPRPPKKIKLPT